MPNFEKDILAEQKNMQNSLDEMLVLSLPGISHEQEKLRATYSHNKSLFEDTINLPGVVFSDKEKENFFEGVIDTFPRTYLKEIQDCTDDNKFTSLIAKITSIVDISNLTAICGGYYAKVTSEKSSPEDYNSQLTDLNNQLAEKNQSLIQNTIEIQKAKLAVANYKNTEREISSLAQLTYAQQSELDIRSEINDLKTQIAATKKSFDKQQAEKMKTRDEYIATRIRELDGLKTQLESLLTLLSQPSHTIIQKDLIGRERPVSVSLEVKLANLLGIDTIPNPIKQIHVMHLKRILIGCISGVDNSKQMVPMAAGLDRVKSNDIAARREMAKTMLVSPSSVENSSDIDPLDALLGLLGENETPRNSAPNNVGRKNLRLG